MLKNLSKLLSKKQKIQSIILLFMMVVGGILETAAVTLIIPIVGIILNPDSVQSNSLLRRIYQFLGLSNENQFLIVIILAMIFIYVFKNVFLLIMYYLQAKFVTKGQYLMSNRILSYYMNRPYEFYLNASTGDIIRIIQGDVGNAFSLVMNVLQFLTEFIVFLCLIMLLMYLDPALMIGIAVILGLTMWISKKVCQTSLEKAGRDMQKYSSSAYKWLIQSIEGIKEIKILKKEKYFQEQYKKDTYKTSMAQRKNSILSQTPRLVIETISMGGMLGMIAILLYNGRSIQGMATQITAFAMAAMRLMPSANRMNAFLNTISFLQPSLLTVVKEVEECDQYFGHKVTIKQEGDLSFQKEIKVDKVEFAYPNCENNLFRDATMKIPIGKSVAVIGTSGSGKTTIIDILLGLLQIKSGAIRVDDTNIQENYPQWLNLIGYIPQTIFMLDGTIRQNVAFGVSEEDIDEGRVWKVLEDAQLKKHIESLPEGLDTEIGEKGVRLSGGQRQRLGIARALYHNPEILIFDEATSALDNDTEAAIMESIQKFQGEKTMVIIAHRLGTIKDCDMIYRVENGNIEEVKDKTALQ